MGEYIGIHTFIDGSLGIEKTVSRNRNYAYEEMERNDSHLLVLSRREFKRISKLSEEDLKGKIVPV